MKTLSKQIGPLKKAGESADELMSEVARAKIIIESSENSLGEITGKINDSLSRMPNLISAEVPVGADEDSNVEVGKWGEPRKFDFDVKDLTVESHGVVVEKQTDNVMVVRASGPIEEYFIDVSGFDPARDLTVHCKPKLHRGEINDE